MGRSPQSILADVCATLASSLTAEDILATVARQIGEAMGVFSCDIWDLGPAAHELTFVASWCAADPNPFGDALGSTAELDGWDSMRAVIEHRRTVELHDDDPDLAPTDRESFERWGFTATIDAPLMHGGEVVGVLGLVETREPRRFTPAERELFGQLAVQAAIAINNSHAFRRLEQQNRQLQSLHEIGNALTSTLVFEEALDVMAREAAEALGVARCIINEVVDGAEALRQLVVFERRPGGGRRSRREMPQGARRSDHLLVAGGPFVEQASDPALDPAARSEMATRGEKTSLSVPLVYKGVSLGLLRLVETRRERQFSPAELELAAGIGEQAALAFQNARLYRSLQQEADTDGLTGLYNHRRFRERLYEEFVRARRYNLPLTVLMIDIDDFKAINDDYGHLIGDEVLRSVAGTLQRGLRRSIDFAARYGGEEFAVLLPNTPPREDEGDAPVDVPPAVAGPTRATPHHGGARQVAERIRAEVQASTEHPSLVTPGTVTVSVGVALLTPDMLDASSLMRAADAALYAAKHAGKNAVVVG